jgi:hypothetical protein
VVATALVVLGSLFYVQRQREVSEQNTSSIHSRDRGSSKPRHSEQSIIDHGGTHSRGPGTPLRVEPDQAMDNSTIHGDVFWSVPPGTNHSAQLSEYSPELIELDIAAADPTYATPSPRIRNKHRNRVANLLHTVGDYLGTPGPEHFDDSAFKREGQHEFPAIPGEAERVARFAELRDQYRIHRENDEGIITPGLSRINSYSSIRTAEGGSSRNRGVSPARPPRSPVRSSTTPVEQNGHPSEELNRIPTCPVAGPSRDRVRRATLEVPNRPSPVHLRLRSDSSSTTATPNMIPDPQGSPIIVVSAEPEETSPSKPMVGTSPPGSP